MAINYIKESEKYSAANIKPKNGDYTKVEQTVSAAEVPPPVAERTDYTNAVKSETGTVSEQDSPRDTNATPTPQPTATQGANTSTGTIATQSEPQASTPQTEAQAPLKQSALLTPASEFEGKRKSFFNPDTRKGFFETLDKKMEEALRGNSPEEIAQNMAFAALTMVFEMIANACDHDRHEFNRLKEEYAKRVAENDGPDGAGVGQTHKSLMFWAVVASHPDMQQYIGKPITKEAKEAALNVIKKDKDAQDAFRMIVSSACGREVRNSELDTFITKALNTNTGTNTIADLKGRALNDEVVKRGISLSGPRGDLTTLHQRCRAHAEDVRSHRHRRDDLNRRRSQNRQDRARQQRREHQYS